MQENDSDNVTKKARHTVQPRRAFIISLLLPLVLYGFVAAVFGDNLFLFSRVPAGKEHRAAVVIRAPESNVGKWASRVLMEPYLRDYYSEYSYFTMYNWEDHKNDFKEAMQKLLTKYPNVDLYILSHGNKYIKWVEPLPEDMRQHLRFVYNSGCLDLTQGEAWISLGAESYVGHAGIGLSAYFFTFFLRHWMHGESVEESIQISNHRMYTTFKTIKVFSLLGLEPANLVEFLGRESVPSAYIFDAEFALESSKGAGVGNTALCLEDMP